MTENEIVTDITESMGMGLGVGDGQRGLVCCSSWTINWRRKWQPTPVFLPGEFHGQRSLAGYSPWSRKELDS